MTNRGNLAWATVLSVFAVFCLIAITSVLFLGLTRFWSQQRGPEVSALLRIQSATPTQAPMAQTYRNTQVALLRSPFVLQAAMSKPEVSQMAALQNKVDPVQWIQEHLSVDCVADSEIIRISMAGSNATDGITLVDAIVESYFNKIVNTEASQRTETLDELRASQREERERVRAKLLDWASDENDSDAAQVAAICDEQWRLEEEQLAIASKLAKLNAGGQPGATLKDQQAAIETQLAQHTAAFQALLKRANLNETRMVLSEVGAKIQQLEAVTNSIPQVQILQSATASK